MTAPTRSSLKPEEIHYIVAGAGGSSIQNDLHYFGWDLSVEQYVLIGTLFQLGQGVKLEACKDLERKGRSPIVHVSAMLELEDVKFVQVVAARDVPDEQKLEQSETNEVDAVLNGNISRLLQFMRRPSGPSPILCCSN